MHKIKWFMTERKTSFVERLIALLILMYWIMWWIPTHTNAYTVNVHAINFDCHYIKDTVGSRIEYSK